MKQKIFLLLFLILSILGFLLLNESVFDFPHLIFRTFLRMILAYILSIIFSVSLGLFMVHNPKWFKLLFPVLDVLQSVPILGFLPFAVIFIINLIPIFGAEISTIFLIFTCMTWSIIFNVIESIRAIPSELKDASRLNSISGSDYLIHVLFPSLFPAIISGSVSGWGGGWYFLVAGEYVSFGEAPPYSLPGVGSFIAHSAFDGNIALSLFGLAVLSLMVLFMNFFIWNPLLSRSSRYSYSQTQSQSSYIRVENNIFTNAFDSIYSRIKNWFSKSNLIVSLTKKFNISPTAVDFSSLSSSSLNLGIAALFIFGALMFILGRDLNTIPNYFFSLLFSFLRIFVAFIFVTLWTVPVAIFLGRNRKIAESLLPVFDVCQSIPAIAVFPIILVSVINLIGGNLGLEISSILLLMTGMQWYLLFNLLRAVSSIPNDLIEASSMLRFSKIQKLYHLYLPAIVPSFIIGSIQAFGGGWNALIVGEHIKFNNQIFSTYGIGSLLVNFANLGDTLGIVLSILVLVFAIVMINSFVWKRALKLCENFKI